MKGRLNNHLDFQTAFYASTQPKGIPMSSSQQTLSLRLKKAGCAFQFKVDSWTQNTAPTAADHQTAVISFFEQIIRPQYNDLRKQTHSGHLAMLNHLQSHPNPKSHQQDLQRLRKQMADDDARLTLQLMPERMFYVSLPPLSAPQSYQEMLQNRDWHTQNWGAQLCHQFMHPPYDLQNLDEKARLVLWQDFCDLCGLNHPQAHIYDWVRHQAYADDFQEGTLFSNYFDDGLDWWGVWCLSVYQPEAQTLAVMTASAID